MATPLYDQMSALLAYANEVTGASDTKLGDAVYSLAEGYGGGGGSSNEPIVSYTVQIPRQFTMSVTAESSYVEPIVTVTIGE